MVHRETLELSLEASGLLSPRASSDAQLPLQNQSAATGVVTGTVVSGKVVASSSVLSEMGAFLLNFLREMLSARSLIFPLAVFLIAELIDRDSGESWNSGAWRSLKRVPVLGCGFDFLEDVSEWATGMYYVGFKHALVPTNLDFLWSVTPSKETMVAFLGNGKTLAMGIKGAIR